MKANSGMLCAVLCLCSATIIESQEQQPPFRTGLVRAYAMGDIVVIATNPAVQRELGLTPMAAEKVQAVLDAFVENVQKTLPPGSFRYRLGVTDDGVPRNVQGTTLATREAFKAAIDQYLVDLKEVLSAEQFARLRQINYQVAGTSAFEEVDVTEALMITKEQQELILSIANEYGAKRQELVSEVGGQLGRHPEVRNKLADMNKEEDRKINEVLTKAQLEKFVAMKGNDFDISPLTNRVGGLGGRNLFRNQSRVGTPLLMGNQRTGIFDLIENAAVQKELAISPDEAINLGNLAREFRTTARQAAGAFPNSPNNPAADRVKQIQKMSEADAVVAETLRPKLKAILSVDQFARLQQIHWQALGASAISESDMAEALPIDKVQQDQIAAIIADFQNKRIELVTNESGNVGLTLREKLLELNKDRDAKLEGVLTKVQRDKFVSLQGAKFDIPITLAPGDGQPMGQRADPDFDVTIANPAFVDRHPTVLFDEAHNNFHTSKGRYSALADLMKNDGCRVTPGTEKFTPDQVSKYEILIIANAPAGFGRSKSAFSEDECDTVHDWVKAGGALLLVTDHEPFGSGSVELGLRFGVNMSTRSTSDPANNAARGLLFSREKNQIGDHPIMAGRNPSEVVNRVLTFTGQSLEGPEGSVGLLKFADTATERDPAGKTVSAAGRCQGIAFKYHRGRVVVMGEAAQLSAQVAGFPPQPMGMNVPGCDNRQMAINIIRWLGGLPD